MQIKAIISLTVLLTAPGLFILARAVVASPTGNKGAEKLILGFEESELGRGKDIAREIRSGRDSWFYVLEQPEGFDFAARFEWPGATNRAWTWRCRSGPHTEGKLALEGRVGPANPQHLKATYQQTAFLSRYYPSVRQAFEVHPLLASFQWLMRADPSLRDWSGYDWMRVDVRCDATPVKLWLAVEDDLIEPPVVRIYNIPKGNWFTVELDLNEAARTRGLDLAHIHNFWLLGQAPVETKARIDNIRIVTRDVPARMQLVRDESPMELALTRPEKPQRDFPKGFTPERSPIQLTKPVVVAQGSVVPFGWVTAYDNNYLMVAYSFKEDGKRPVAKAVYTADGGQSWQPLPEPAARNLDHGTARGCAIDASGDGVAISSGPGCGGLGHTTPRQHLTKYTFTGTGWEAESPTILDSDIRHCGSNASVIRLHQGLFRGRLWASWGHLDRAHRLAVHVKFSDDGGRTWLPWGNGAHLPGSEADPKWSNQTYDYPETVLTPYKNHIACFWRHRRGSGIFWSVYDGTTWSSPGEVSPVTLDRMDTAYRATMSAVTRKRDEIFFTATGLGTVLRWNGQSWVTEPLTCEDGGMLSLAGDLVTLFTAGTVNRRWKGLDWSRRTTLRYYRRSANGLWEDPRELTGEFDLHEYRSLAGFSVPPYAPANFVPLAWSDFNEGTVKLLKVPIAPTE